MAAYDDRPLSVYDNLNISTPTSTLTNNQTKSKGAHIHFESLGTPISTVNEQQQTKEQNLNKLNNSNKAQVQTTTTYYVTPYKTATAIATTSSLSPVTTLANNTSLSLTALTTSITPTPTTNTTKTTIPETIKTVETIVNVDDRALSGVDAAERPLSQYSQSEAYEASQSIAAVKAALNDAKSRFFGLNGYAQINNNQIIQHQQQQQQQQQNHNNIKPQPKYQNIPENSAIFRNHNINFNTTPTSKPTIVPGTTKITGETTNNHKNIDISVSDTKASVKMPSTSASAKLLPQTAIYTQIPLNDVLDGDQPSQVSNFSFNNL